MKTIVITGSTRGIGFGMAENFLRLGQRVMISGRSQESVDRALNELGRSYSSDQAAGYPCVVQDYLQVKKLWDYALRRFGQVDIWINNAGIATPQTDFWELEEKQIVDLVSTNIIGVMYGARVALAGFIEKGQGALYNMEGLGSDGRRVDGLTLYGTTKRAINYLTESLAAEVQGTGVIVGSLSPGMVLTDLILKQYEGRELEEWESARKIFNILADRVETVTPYLAKQVINNTKNGVRLRWLTGGKVFWRFLTARLSSRDVIGDLGTSSG